MMDNICSSCAYLIYDEDYEEYICDCQMDEDDYSRMIQGNSHIHGHTQNVII